MSFAQLAANAADLLDDLGAERIVLVGHSMGGMPAARLALMEPDRVERLLLVNALGLPVLQSEGVPHTPLDAAFEGELRTSFESIDA